MGMELDVAGREPVNQLLYVNLVKMVILPLNDLVEWDRYGLRGDGGFAFGWIKRDDGFYDFVSVTFQLSGNAFGVSYTTSSKRYSKEIAGRFGNSGTAVYDYLECKPASDIPEANLVTWQKERKVILCAFLIGIVMLRFFSPAFVDIFNSGNYSDAVILTGFKKPPSRANLQLLENTGRYYSINKSVDAQEESGDTQTGKQVASPIVVMAQANL